ncbi:carbohydrate ABC transporter permease [Actinophytocola xanthii]|uniref:ABC transporter permease n=1 Tax=Actinophytocola xanthii TaxID=1912961 RepID=A0A1Q8CRS3_9PSEU|nr:carbohydrate ABC transporter permease [Actinophytocola xanthii]OLF17065.1 ABC transporter permease [Actinophytocola xanthii]
MKTATPHDRPNWFAGTFTAAWLVIVGVPLYTMVSWSLQTRDGFLDNGPIALPRALTLENFFTVVNDGFGRYLVNTVIVTVACVVLTLVAAIPAAYAIVRSRSWLASTAFRIFLLGLAIPAQATIIPLYLIINRLQLYDSLTAIVLPTVAFGLPLAILVLAGSLRDVSDELYDAMTVDGAGPFRILWQLVVPVSRGSIAAVGTYAALGAWNQFLFPLILTQDPDLRTLTLGLTKFRQEFQINLPGMMMAVLLTALPVFVLYLVARRWLIAGLAGMGGR